MARNVVRLGDTSSHGGTVISASTNVKANKIGVARDGDLHSCPIPNHGITSISAALSKSKANGRKIAVVGDSVGCGATLTSGSHDVKA